MPDGRRFGHVNGGLARGTKIGQLTLIMGPARTEVCGFVQRATIPSDRVIFLHSQTPDMHAINIMYVLSDVV